MDYPVSDSSGTDDDLPPPHQNRYARNARVAGNGRSAVAGSTPYSRVHNDMETQIHIIEQEAYFSVLRAFKAQSDAISWEMEALITELRKELRVSDDEHRELLSRVNNDDMIRRIREWRKTSGIQPGMMNSSQPVPESTMPSPTVSQSRKKQKTSQSVASLSVGAPSPVLHPSMQPSSSVMKRGPPQGGRGKKSKSFVQSMQYPPTAPPGRPQPNRGAADVFVGGDPGEPLSSDPLIGRRVWTRWPDDNNWYEALIMNVKDDRHALVYDLNTPQEAIEWVNIKEIAPEDIAWEDPAQSNRGGRSGRGMKKSSGRGGAVSGAGRGRGTLKGHPKKDMFPPQNGIGRKVSGDFELLHTDTLIKEVEKVFSTNHPDPMEVEKAKKVLKEHEQALVEAIARLEEASDGESDERDRHFSQGQEQGWRKRQYDALGRDGRGFEGADGDKGRLALEKQQEA